MPDLHRCILLCSLLGGCGSTNDPAKTEPAKTEPTKSEPAKTEPTTAEPANAEPAEPAEPAKPAKAEPAKAGGVIDPPVPESGIRLVESSGGKLEVTFPVDHPVVGSKELSALYAKHPETDGREKKIDPADPGLPAGFREGDAWVVVLPTGPEVVKVTGVGIDTLGGWDPGEGPRLAHVVLRDDTSNAYGLAWPGEELPAGAKLRRAPEAQTLEHPDDATLARLLAWLRESSVAKPKLAEKEPKREQIRVMSGKLARGHSRLAVLSVSMPWEADANPLPHLQGVWTLGEPGGPPPEIENVFLNTERSDLAFDLLVDWNGDGIDDALVLAELGEGDVVQQSLVWWQAGAPRNRVLVPFPDQP
jgi:hypothetical protein